MKTYLIVGYTEPGAFYCPDCFAGPTKETGAVFAGDEFDSYPVCDCCGERCEDVALTLEGWEAEQRRLDNEDAEYEG